LQDRDVAMAPGDGSIDAGVLARLAAERWQAGALTERLEPRYLHAPDVTLTKGATQ
jgi:hypothetical protein